MIYLPDFNNQKTLGLGCATFGGSKSKKVALRSLHHAFEHDVIYYDVARSYGYGQAESILGQFAKGRRDKIIITTKFGIAPPRPFPFMTQVKDMVRFARKIAPGLTSKAINSYSVKNVSRPKVSPEMTVQSLEKSLLELKTDYVDFFLLHDVPFEDAIREEMFYQLEKEKEKGKIRAWGATCEDQHELPKYFKKGNPFGVVQFQYSPQNPIMENTDNQAIAKVVFSVMNRGIVPRPPESSFFERMKINQLVPGLVENLSEAWLYIATQELDRGAILCTMTQPIHIDRNIRILKAPGIPPHDLKWMKTKVMNYSTTNEPEIAENLAGALKATISPMPG